MKLLILTFLISFTNITKAQNCKVLADSLKGDYAGECKKGLANGQGTAIGADSYSGSWKNGYPDGKGKYIWRNGNWFDGFFKKGACNGEGTLYVAKTDSSDGKEVKGLWENGEYKKTYKESYTVKEMSNNIGAVNIRKIGKIGEQIIISVKSITGGGLSLIGGEVTNGKDNGNGIAKPKLTNIETESGSYSTKIVDESSPVYNKYTLQNIVFPITLWLYFDSERVKIEISEKATWNIEIHLDK
jgi:hypothetical protein